LRVSLQRDQAQKMQGIGASGIDFKGLPATDLRVKRPPGAQVLKAPRRTGEVRASSSRSGRSWSLRRPGCPSSARFKLTEEHQLIDDSVHPEKFAPVEHHRAKTVPPIVAGRDQPCLDCLGSGNLTGTWGEVLTTRGAPSA
jgi:hypothetical protein